MTKNGLVSRKEWTQVSRHFTIDDIVIDNGGVFEVIEPVWYSLDIYNGEKEYVDCLSKITEGQKHIVTIEWHRAEVNNGGHYQFFTNSTGIVWREAMLGYRTLGLDMMADILQDAANMYGGDLSLDRTTRENLLDSKPYDLENLDDRFSKLEISDEIEIAIMKYIRSHRSEFYFDAEVLVYE